ncbi:cation-translocating P-type ATPase [Candidatus Nomurabacteria bacterium]|nr:cation-translocating P-type ATPase [Candidatus Nomurabacteria bacterium]MCB9827374.1 cation-translocating P-type ATPase [Candidatus Nomurabacteria bacterium]HXK52672.1 cation-translocating P-type ATPase [bacterium]
MFHTLTLQELLQKLNTSIESGLRPEEIEKRLAEFGPNSLPEPKKISTFQKILSQFSDVLVLVLIAAAIVSFAIGEHIDAVVITTIVLINAFMGYIQEARAEKAIEALKKMTTDYAKVIINGELTSVLVERLVPGDIIILESGDRVPADARLIEVANLQISEAVLTGESNPVNKHINPILQEDLALGDRKNMVYKNTTVVFGRGKAVVTGTGKDTEIGKISMLLSESDKEDTPLSKELAVVGKRLSSLAGLIILVIFTFAFLSHELDIKDSFLTAISLAVAAIPEGLPAIVTVILATGVSQLAKSKAIVRRLQAVETLGSTSYILTDKTGTLTQNKMSATNVATLNENYTITQIRNDGFTFLDSKKDPVSPNQQEDLKLILLNSILCNDAEASSGTSNDSNSYIGDPTETALIELGIRAGLNIKETRKSYNRLYEIPFSSETKRMVVVTSDPENSDEAYVFAKGAPEIIQEMVPTENEIIENINNNYAAKGLRSLGLAYKKISRHDLAQVLEGNKDDLSLIDDLEFIGIVAQKDPLRPEVKDALNMALAAGIKTIVLTGDHKLTATTIAKELGLIRNDDEVMDGPDLAKLDDQEIINALKTVKVFSRVSPEQKLRIVQVIKGMGNITAVTGDGVNDAPAIKAADIGISMGISGTDVSKEVSDMVLQDDNYATIVKAIKEGRVIYDNLIKFISYLISCNMSEIFVVGLAMVAKLPLPMLPIQILWINLITDGLPALALGMEPGEKDIMLRQPRKQGNLLTKKRWVRMTIQGASMTVGVFGVFLFALRISPEAAQSAAFTALAMSQLFHAFNSRSEHHSIFSRTVPRNNFLIATFVLSVFLQLMTLYSWLGNTYLKTTPIPISLFILALLSATIPVVVTEIYKLLQNRAKA